MTKVQNQSGGYVPFDKINYARSIQCPFCKATFQMPRFNGTEFAKTLIDSVQEGLKNNPQGTVKFDDKE